MKAISLALGLLLFAALPAHASRPPTVSQGQSGATGSSLPSGAGHVSSIDFASGKMVIDGKAYSFDKGVKVYSGDEGASIYEIVNGSKVHYQSDSGKVRSIWIEK